MSEFEEALKRSVLGLGEAYLAAEKDLQDETALASESVKKITQGIAQLVLKKRGEDSDGTILELFLAAEKEVSSLAVFLISPKGYPIKAAANGDLLALGLNERVIETREHIRAYFNTMASSPDSRLVLRIASLLRGLLQAKKQPA